MIEETAILIKKDQKEESKKSLELPQHVAIVMDGNRRWAKKNKLKIIGGHKKGVESFGNILEFLAKEGVEIFTIFAFSTENWKRGEQQVSDLLKVLSGTMKEKADELVEKNVVLNIIGDLKRFPENLQADLRRVEERSKGNSGITLNVALNYGGRDEIVRAVNRMIDNGEKVVEENLGEYLDTAGQPDPDVVIRTGGAKRLSNFLLWQGSYSELFFTDTLWPDFDEKEMKDILEEYAGRKRNFGT